MDYKTLKAQKRCRRFKTCDRCSKETLTLVEGESVLDDYLFWQSEHSGKPHPNSKSVVEIVTEWMLARGVSVEELTAELRDKLKLREAA